MINDFQNTVDGWVLDAIKKGIIDFNDLILTLPGVYPSMVLSSLKRLVQNKEISSDIQSDIMYQVKEPKSQFQGRNKNKISLPLPHPLDFEWRFADSASKYLLSICLKLTSPKDNILLLGTPSLLKNIANHGYQRKVIFIGDSTAVVDKLKKFAPKYKIICCNFITDSHPEITASVVILDPPWYKDFIYPFLWMAMQSCKFGGYVMISLPALGTRPSVKQEWDSILEWSEDLGLSLYKLEPCALYYSTPFFEQNALKAEGILNFPKEWRKSNFAIFKRTKHNIAERPQIPQTKKWKEVLIDNVRLRVADDSNNNFEDPSIISIITGDILPSVSRNDPRRNFADVWTSGNRIYKCQGKKTLLIILNALVANQSPQNNIEKFMNRCLKVEEINKINQTIQQIESLVKLENNELLIHEE
ncbi:MAG: hypothetical protein JYX80_05130 [Candidatus Scalindua sediminis]|nr:hypothetical protein [Candidatus Scalindua sediminis]